MQYVIFSMLLSPCLSQMADVMEMRPDVTFGEQNDRFDLSAMMSNQNMFMDNEDRHIEEPEEKEDYRRSSKDINQLAKELRRKVRENKDFDQFAYHDNMDSDEGGNKEDFERSLRAIKNGRRSRKAIDKDVLFNHAVPVLMTIKGYIQPPLYY